MRSNDLTVREYYRDVCVEEGAKKLALILVELISPDIMYNGIPWPEDEFIKVNRKHILVIIWMFSFILIKHSRLKAIRSFSLNLPALKFIS